MTEVPVMGLFGTSLEKLATREDVRGLAKATLHPDPVIRRAAVDALGHVARVGDAALEARLHGRPVDERAVTALVRALGDTDRVVREKSAEELGRIGDNRAVETLIVALGDPEATVREKAVRALGAVSDKRAVEPIIAALDDPATSVRTSATTVLGTVVDLQGPVRPGVPGLKTTFGGERAVEPLMRALDDAEAEVRGCAAEALGEIGDARSVEALVEVLGDSEQGLRYRAAEALGRIADTRAVEPLVAALGDVPAVREVAMKALDAMGWSPRSDWERAVLLISKGSWAELTGLGASAVETLIGELDRPYVAQPVIDALGEIGEPALAPLLDAVGQGSAHVVNGAARALGALGDPRALEPLLVALNNQDFRAREGAAEALGAIGDPRAVPRLIGALSDPHLGVRHSAAQALGRIGDPEAVTPLIRAMNEQNSDLPGSAVDALVEIGAPSVEPVAAALSHLGSQGRRHAAEVLKRLGDDRGIDDLIRESARHEATDLWTAATLVELQQPSSPLVEVLRSGDPKAVAERYAEFIRLGVRGTEAMLGHLLASSGDSTMARDFLNCGNDELASAAVLWARRHGFDIVREPGHPGPTWGAA